MLSDCLIKFAFLKCIIGIVKLKKNLTEKYQLHVNCQQYFPRCFAFRSFKTLMLKMEFRFWICAKYGQNTENPKEKRFQIFCILSQYFHKFRTENIKRREALDFYVLSLKIICKFCEKIWASPTHKLNENISRNPTHYHHLPTVLRELIDNVLASRYVVLIL